MTMPLETFAGSFDRPRAAHLLRRAGFAPNEAELRAALKDGLRATVDRLLDADTDSPEHAELDEIGAALAARNDIHALRGWWLLRMCRTQRPLHARLALFWHNHFATSNAKLNSAALMLQQLRTFERHGPGRFDELLLALARDPAMLVWLDGDQNVKGRPNENFARELFELFSLGVGNYSEHDIKEAARAFTGWRQHNGLFRFAPSEHDDGAKTVFGRTGNFDGADIVRLAIGRPECGRFLATKLLREFVAPQPDNGLVEAVAGLLRSRQFDIRETLRVLLMSESFFGDESYRARIKSPVEFAVGVVRSLHLKVPAELLGDTVTQMGQRLFEPPSVKGWDGQRAWLNSATMLVRLNAASQAIENQSFGAGGLLNRYSLQGAADIRDFCDNLVLDGRPPAVLRDSLQKLSGGDDDVLRRALGLLLTAPEYQMA